MNYQQVSKGSVIAESRAVRCVSAAFRFCFRASGNRGMILACFSTLFFCLGQMANGVQKAENVVRADTVVANKFELAGPKGLPAASLQKGINGEAMLNFYDDKGTVRVTVGFVPDAKPALILSDAEGRARISLALDEKNGYPILVLSDGSFFGGTSIRMSVVNGGPHVGLIKAKVGEASMSVIAVPVMRLSDSSGKTSISLRATEGGPRISMNAKSRIIEAELQAADGSSKLSLADDQGWEKLRVAVDKDGEPDVRKNVPAKK